MPAIHYKYGGSTAGRTLQCSAWIPLSKRLPRQGDGSNPHADRGTLLHDCMEVLLKNPDMDLLSLRGKTYKGQEVTDEEIHDAIIPALNAYIDFADKHDIQIELPEVEVKSDDDIGGTSDIICANEDTVFIIDWKFGFNPVSAEENPQGLFYAMCARLDTQTASLFKDRKKLCMVIIQPTGDGDALSEWWCDIERLNDFEDDYMDAVENEDETKPLVGKYCAYCPAMAFCPAKTGQVRAALMLDPNTDQADVLVDALKMADEVILWANTVKKTAHEQAELGTKLKGYKLVDKRATRKWINEEEALDLFRRARKLKLEDVVDQKLKSPTQLEKVCKKKAVDFSKYASYIEKVSTGTTLTTADDKRSEVFNLAGFADAINITD
jgi:hypothetical protein